MKILAISDVHGEDNENLYKYLNNNDIDIVIITGDITNFGPLEFVDEFISKILDCDCEVMAVPGNCDPAGICKQLENQMQYAYTITFYLLIMLFYLDMVVPILHHLILLVKFKIIKFMGMFMNC